MDVPQKSKKRAARRKRNLVARELRTNKAYVPKVVGLVKHKRPKKVSVKDVERFLDAEQD